MIGGNCRSVDHGEETLSKAVSHGLWRRITILDPHITKHLIFFFFRDTKEKQLIIKYNYLFIHKDVNDKFNWSTLTHRDKQKNSYIKR